MWRAAQACHRSKVSSSRCQGVPWAQQTFGWVIAVRGAKSCGRTFNAVYAEFIASIGPRANVAVLVRYLPSFTAIQYPRVGCRLQRLERWPREARFRFRGKVCPTGVRCPGRPGFERGRRWWVRHNPASPRAQHRPDRAEHTGPGHAARLVTGEHGSPEPQDGLGAADRLPSPNIRSAWATRPKSGDLATD
jgi:hypothetical protein